jgi:dipeptidyl aminopeptidase/acylaminoacyl peptidase
LFEHPATSAQAGISPPQKLLLRENHRLLKSKAATPTELQITPVIPFTAESIGPGRQEAYSSQSSSGEEIIFLLYLPEDYDERQK